MNTLRSQILFAVTLVTFTASSVIMYFVYVDTDRVVREREVKSIENILKFIELNLIDNHNYLLQSKYEYIAACKNTLKNNVLLIEGIYSSLKKSMSIALQSSSRNTKRNHSILDNVDQYLIEIIKNRINFIQQDKTIGWMLIDKDGNVVLSTDNSLEGKNIGFFNDLAGHKFAEKYHKASLSHAGQFAVFIPQKIEHETVSWKLGYFIQLPDGSETIASFVEAKTLYEKGEYIIDYIKSSIKMISSQMNIAETGFVFIFRHRDDKDTEMIVPPRDRYVSSFLKKNQEKNCFDKIKAMNNKNKLTTQVACSDFGNTLNIYTRYFKGFDWYVSVALPSSEVAAPARDIIRKLFYSVIVIFFISIVFFVYIISMYTKPLTILSLKMKNVPEHDFTDSNDSELTEDLPVATNNEIGRLAETFAYMIEKLSSSIKQLIETTKTNERIESELNLAREIQLGTLPKDFSFKTPEIYADLIPAREIGGDLYDFFFIDEDNLCFSVGDVAGKSVSAALTMFLVKKLISSNAHKGRAAYLSPAEIMEQINEIVCKDNPTSTFITLFIGILNVKSGELLYANGGHVPPIFVDCGSEPKYRKDLSGPAVGIRPGISYKEISMALRPGDAVFLCTDGVTEAMNEKDKLFSDRRLLENFCRMKDKSCKEVVEGILYEVRTHAGNAPQSDDIAMLMVRWGIQGEQNENRA